MSNFLFWQKWLFGIGSLLTVFGLALTCFNQTPVFDALFNNQITPVFWPAHEITPQIIRFQQWICGVLGATIAGWGIFTVFLAHYPFRNKERWARNAIALGITVWFVTDTSLSVYFLAMFNAAFKTVVFVAVLLPLLFTRHEFNQGRA
ncbi:MAG: hypothetical protein HYU42_04505 [Candidatus Rokubacteria bacterium]|nr:hypothetical protein [Candidatus Rokubacteria bacterium]MBI3105827.1 hypothetical protein [Candidatus Rokubacteria bacterium]